MATLARQRASPDSVFCQPWSSSVSAAELRPVGEMLRRRLFPSPQDFHLVVCHVCKQVVTTQSILAHYERRHGSPVPSRSPVVLMKAKAPAATPAVTSGAWDTLAFRIPKDYPHSRFSKAPLAVYPPKGARNKTCVSLPVVSLEKIPCLSSRSDSQVRLSPSPLPSASPHKQPPLTSPAKLINGRGSGGPSTPRSSASPSSQHERPGSTRSPLDRRPSTSPSPSPLDRKPSPTPSPSKRPLSLLSSPLDKKNQNGAKTSSRSHKILSGRVFDPNKHCGVLDPDTKQPCTRSLTCKTHSLTHRRGVPGRKKHFDILLAEHRGRTKEKEGAKDKDKEGNDSCSPSLASQEATASPSKPPCPNGRPLSSLKLRLANAHIPRVPGITASTPQPQTTASFPAPASNPEPPPHSCPATAGGEGGRLSSDEAEAETPEDADRPPAFHFSNVHPKPSGFCIFNSRLMGRGHFVFDRRWDKMRLALQNMVEKHLNAQMWRKVPLAAESLPSASPSGTSQLAHPPSPKSDTFTSTSNPVSCGVSLSAPGGLTFKDAHLSTLGVSRHAAHKVSRLTKEREDSRLGADVRKNSSCSFPTVDTHKRNGTSYHPTQQRSGGPGATPARKKGHGPEGNGLWSYSDRWLTRAEGSHSRSSRNHANSSKLYPSSMELSPASSQTPSSSGALTYGRKAEGRKRRSPSSYDRKAVNKLSRLDALFGNDSESQKQLPDLIPTEDRRTISQRRMQIVVKVECLLLTFF
ncbi:ataxin-7-like protein 1 isoform X3 [Nerophis ophidion]|uniref:ataxin-7-like protein 1 isoform X3 n=1 Tax=Nerophis ophidion TaxID=159077 RepID=UPI002ADF4551|nr:ataxin-7-like protein 1 isoform X3 [Nerophis ophidion]